MSEKDTRREFLKLTRPLDPHPIENIVGIGTPDVWLSVGAVELKYLRAWPARETTQVKLDHYTDEQRTWLINRWNAGGGAWLVLQCRTNWLCFEAPAAMKVGHLTKAELFETATHSSFVKPTSEVLCGWLKRTT